jgi:hypothetical protein
MPTTVACPSCARRLNVPDELLAAQVRCPACGTAFVTDVAPAGAAAGGSAAGPPDPSPDNGEAASADSAVPRVSVTPGPSAPGAVPRAPLPDGARESCPYCGEPVSALASRCPRCGESREGDERPWEEPYRRSYGRRVRRDCEPHRGTLVLVLGILSLVIGYIGLPLGIAAWMMGRNDLAKMKTGAMDPEGRGLTQAGWVCGIIGTIYQGFLMLMCLAYLGFMFTMIGATAGAKPARPMTATPVPNPPPPVEAPVAPDQGNVPPPGPPQ